FGSLRMEPTYMILGHSAATAAALAVRDQVAVQDVPYPQLSRHLIEQGQLLGTPAGFPGALLDDDSAILAGEWQVASTVRPWIGNGYRHDGNQNKGHLAARFEFTIDQPGRYEVRLAYSQHANRATNVPVAITHRGGVAQARVD